jgi:transcriptional regulator with XRE-family HTH domain
LQDQLRAARDALGWTQQHAGEAAGVHPTLVSSLENGAAERLAHAMSVELRARLIASLDDEPDAEILHALRGLKVVKL